MKNITNSFIKLVFVFTNRFQKIIAHKMGVLKFLLFLLFNSPKKSPKTEPWRSRYVSLKIVVKNWAIDIFKKHFHIFLLQYFAPVEMILYSGGIHTRLTDRGWHIIKKWWFFLGYFNSMSFVFKVTIFQSYQSWPRGEGW